MTARPDNTGTLDNPAANSESAGHGDAADAQPLLAGVARMDITDYEAGPVHDPLFVKALVLRQRQTTMVIATVDAVALAEIGRIPNDYLATVRRRLQAELGIGPERVLINASHCHGTVCQDVTERTVEAVTQACRDLVPVTAGCGIAHEDRIMENRRLRLHNGTEADSRRAYSLAPDTDLADTGPIDAEIGILRLDRSDGTPLAVLYTLGCHPIQGVPDGTNTADMTGIASTVVEQGLGDGTMALFLQGCGADINPMRYKDVATPPDATPLGTMLGTAVLAAMQTIRCTPVGGIGWCREILALPRADLSEAIAGLEEEEERLVRSLKPSSINLKTYLQLRLNQALFPEYPSYYAHRYRDEERLGQHHLATLDAKNRDAVERYTRNILIMEELTRLQTNLQLLRMHQRKNEQANSDTVDVEVLGVRIGHFVLLTFPGELTVQIGLNIKKASPHTHTFVTGCTNGYIYYAPTARQLQNRGRAQEDSDCFLAAEWQALFENKAQAVLKTL